MQGDNIQQEKRESSQTTSGVSFPHSWNDDQNPLNKACSLEVSCLLLMLEKKSEEVKILVNVVTLFARICRD